MAPAAEISLANPEVRDDGPMDQIDVDLAKIESEAAKHNEEQLQKQEEGYRTKESKSAKPNDEKRRRLQVLLDKACAYSNFLCQNVQEAKPAQPEDSSDKNTSTKKSGRGRRRQAEVEASKSSKRMKAAEEYRDAVLKMDLEQTADATGAELKDHDQPKSLVGGSLRSYQLRGVRWMANLYENGLNGILADEMGLGKTIQVMGLIAHLVDRNVKGSFLVVAPLSTISNWKREAEKWCPGVDSVIYHGDAEKREEIRSSSTWPKKAQQKSLLAITSYEIAMRDRRYLAQAPWKYLIVDEGHRLKNMNCRLIRELKQLPCENRLLLTGTPLQNNLPELWSLMNFLLPDVFDDLEMFERWFAFGDSNASDIIDAQASDQIVTKLHDILRPFLLRRVKEDVLHDLPKKMEVVVYAQMSEMQRKYYKMILDKSLISYLQETFGTHRLTTRSNSMSNVIMQLRKCINHPYLFGGYADEEGNYKFTKGMVKDSAKIALLDRMLPELRAKGHRTLIFSQMTAMLDILEDYLDGKGYSYCRIDGSTNTEDRQSQMDLFNQSDDIDCFLLSTRAGGLGINLVAADTVILFDSDWNPHQDNQAQDRCHRIGQKKPVVVYRLIVEDSVEDRMMERANTKRKLARLVIHRGSFQSGTQESILTKQELEEILKDDVQTRTGLKGNSASISDKELKELLDRDSLVQAEVVDKLSTKKKGTKVSSKQILRKGEHYMIVDMPAAPL